LSEGEPSLFALAGAIGRHLAELERLDPSVASWAAAHGRALEQWHELQSEVSRYAERIDVDAGRLREMEERLDLLHALRRKYGGSVADVIRFGQKARQDWETLQGREGELERLKRETIRVDQRLAQLGRELTARRVKAAAKLGDAVRRQLAELGFARSQFSVAVDTTIPETMASAPSAGFDQVEFQFAPNVGEPARPLRAIASSGEMARVMLAIKTALAGQDKVPVLVFDEIDANVGGTTARVVGDKMRQIARQHQVLCITHLAPVAAAATTHFLVSKAVRQSRTWSEIRPLQEEERVAEVARMLGGVDAAARQHAEALLSQARAQAPA
jgi:DNA repair protein RecN (Recombination protein N)